MRVPPTGRSLTLRPTPLLAALALGLAPLAAPLAAQQMDHADHLAHAGPPTAAGGATARVAVDSTLPAGAAEAEARLAASPRHGEWVMMPGGAPGDSVRAWVVYPERSDRAPVVLVVHEIYGLSPWIRAVADQLAADGFIAVAPDLLTSKNLPGSPDKVDPQAASAAIRTLDRAVVARQLDAVGRYAMALPAARDRYGIVGFCWGGSTSFAYATHAPRLGASVVYYGGSPDPAALASVRAPVLGLYGGNDARVNATVPAADSAMKAMNKSFETHTFEGAGHGFLRQQDGQNGANLKAAQQAWPRTVAFFRKHLGG
jgi:carboxymethylenebutenolidase